MSGVATHGRRGQDGFTLIEVMAALVVFLVGVVGVLGLLMSGTRLHQDSQNLVMTNDVAEEVLLLAQRELLLDNRVVAAEVGEMAAGFDGRPREPEVEHVGDCRKRGSVATHQAHDGGVAGGVEAHRTHFL